MFALGNRDLEVAILDPVADRDRFGVRYCTGGYIYQITDARVGELMSGPTFPDSFNWFDGQGIPDAFHLSPLREANSSEPVALVLGIGLCDMAAREVREFCDWEITQSDGSITMRTEHRFGSFAVDLERTVGLAGRTVRSTTRVHNRGGAPIPLRWYPHPFYPQPAEDALIKLNIPLAQVDDAGYGLGADGFITRRNWPWDKGYFLALDHGATVPLVVLQKHPKLGLVAGSCSYIPNFFPIWGNPRTFSWEPYLERGIGSGQALSWWIDYDF